MHLSLVDSVSAMNLSFSTSSISNCSSQFYVNSLYFPLSLTPSLSLSLSLSLSHTHPLSLSLFFSLPASLSLSLHLPCPLTLKFSLSHLAPLTAFSFTLFLLIVESWQKCITKTCIRVMYRFGRIGLHPSTATRHRGGRSKVP